MIKVMIVDDEPLVRIGLKSLIDWEENGFVIAGEASNGKEAMELIIACRPDIVITDIKMPVSDGIELIRNIAGLENSPEFIVLSCFNDFEYVREAMKLGALDYLIKSDIKPDQVLKALSGVRKKIENKKIKTKQDTELADSVIKSISLLKEDFFKDLIRGFVKAEDISRQFIFFKSKLQVENLALLMVRMDDFGAIHQKYAGKDEKFLKSTMVNLLDEIIPDGLPREIIMTALSDYLAILNLKSPSHHDDLSKLCKCMMVTIKDYLNISVSIGISKVFTGFENIGTAYHEAEKAVGTRFFSGKGSIAFFSETPVDIATRPEIILDRETEQIFIKQVEAMDNAGCIRSSQELYTILSAQNLSENMVRKMYIQRIELIIASLPGRLQSPNGQSTPYEEILVLETLAEINEFMINFINSYFQLIRDQEFSDSKSYVEQAVEIIKKYYYEDLSLQSVAAQININPSYLSRIFKQEMKENFTSFLTSIRIERAKYYLQLKKFKVYEVADKVGYTNYTYFSRIFKKITGISPEDYR